MYGVMLVSDRLVTGPACEPLDLEEVRKALKITATSEDTLLDLWIAAARQHFEEQTSRQLITATRERTWRGTPCVAELELPHPPLLSIESVVTVDGVGAENTLDADAYEVVLSGADPTCPPGRIRLISGVTWPSTETVKVRYTCGYGAAPGAVPELVRAALHLLVGSLHKFRSETVIATSLMTLPLGAKMILESFKFSALPVLAPARGSWTIGAWQ